MTRRDPLARAQELLDSTPLLGLAEAGDAGAWEAAFAANPDALHHLLADYLKQVYAIPGRVGQRPMPREEVVDLEVLLHGEVADRPLSEILPEVMRPSERAFVLRTCLSRTQLQRVISGERVPNVPEIVSIADAAGLPPVYFREYRHAMVTAAFIQMLNERPGVATHLYRTYLQVTAPKKRRQK